MIESNFSYMEVIPDQTHGEKYKEITLNTGGRQSTLQDIKVVERSNGYCYIDATNPSTRNRFIYWRISHDVLELTEQSLDVNLSENSIRYKFIDTPILDGITIHETHASIIILVPTVCSVHRLVFPHPSISQRQSEYYGIHSDLVQPSIFADASIAQAKSAASFYVITNPSNAGSQLPHCATSWYSPGKDEAYFLLAYPSSDVLLIKQHADGSCESTELKSESIVPRFLHGLAERFRPRGGDCNVVVSAILHTIGIETYAITLSKSGHLKSWSCTRLQCVFEMDILSETVLSHNLLQGNQNHVIRKTVGGDELDFALAVVLNFSPQCQFHIMRPEIKENQFKLVKVNTLFSPGVDLIDFSLTSTRIWSMWRDEDGFCSVYTATLSSGVERGSQWVPVILDPLPDSNEIEGNPDLDPNEIYNQYVFYPGRFSLNVISKALSVYRKSAVFNNVNLSLSVLKEQVNVAVESEIREELQEAEVNDDEYLRCAEWCWSKFCSCCIQYHMTGLRPLGILLLPSVSAAILLKKSTYSFLRPLDTLEHLYLCNEHVTSRQFANHPQLVSLEESDDLLNLMGAIVYLDKQLSEDFKQTFDGEISQLKPPGEIMSDLIAEIIGEEASFFYEPIIDKLKNCRDVYNAMHKLLEMLNVQKVPSEKKQRNNQIFSSRLGISVVSQSLKQQATVKYNICRNLLALQTIICAKNDAEWSFFEGVRSICMPDTILLLQAYRSIVWLTNLPVEPSNVPESSLQKLTTLKLPPAFNLKLSTNTSLLDLFIGSAGGADVDANSPYDDENFARWQYSLLSYLEQVTLTLWPINGDATFAEWLLSAGQHVALQQYVRNLSDWCDSSSSRSFLLAASFLSDGEYHKAYDLFLGAMKGVYTERYLVDHVSNVAASNENLAARYYLRAIQLFEAYGAWNHAVGLARVALAVTETENPLRATLYSIQFKHHLAMGHYEDAYSSLESNPDSERKKDNLRDLVKTLLDRKRLDVLMSFNYCDLDQLFCDILYTRARATDSVDNFYYDFLYSYQIKRGAPYFRIAAAVMYEQAFRLNAHTTIEAIEKQVKCYLAAVNALSLCEERYGWVTRPVEPERQQQEVISPTLAGSNKEYKKIKWLKQVEVVDTKIIREELAIAIARLRLAKIDRSSIALSTTPQELVMMLSCAGLFKCALEICNMFSVPTKIVFEILTHHCVFLSEDNTQDAWNWLTENDLHDLSIIGNSPADVAWQLLKMFVFAHEEENMTTVHRYVCEKMLNLRFEIPHWLLESYKKRNPAELLRLYYFGGYLIEAAKLACEHTLAVLDFGCEYFGYKQPLVPGAKPFCLPVNTIESLLYELKLQNEVDVEKPLEKEYNQLNELFVKYLEVSSRISINTCRAAMSC